MKGGSGGGEEIAGNKRGHLCALVFAIKAKYWLQFDAVVYAGEGNSFFTVKSSRE